MSTVVPVTEAWPASTYYLLSRLINAKLAAQEGREPAYDSPINQMTLRLPVIGNFGQHRLWVIRKREYCDKY